MAGFLFFYLIHVQRQLIYENELIKAANVRAKSMRNLITYIKDVKLSKRVTYKVLITKEAG